MSKAVEVAKWVGHHFVANPFDRSESAGYHAWFAFRDVALAILGTVAVDKPVNTVVNIALLGLVVKAGTHAYGAFNTRR